MQTQRFLIWGPVKSRQAAVIKDRKKYEIQLYQTAIKEYMSSKEKNLSRLIEYAVKLGVRDEVMMYVEVMV